MKVNTTKLDTDSNFRIYLSSWRIPHPKKLSELLRTKLSDTQVAIIPNAKDHCSSKKRSESIAERLKYSADILGAQADVVDLRDYQNSEQVLVALEPYDALWLIGGNSFCLQQAINESGFGGALPEILARGVVYIGESAGAVVAGTALSHITKVDDPAMAELSVDFGCGLINARIMPHADREEYKQSVQEAQSKYGDQLLQINDRSSVICVGGTCTVLT